MADQGLLRGRYRLTRELGRGGFGVVYEATDTQLFDRRCAVKQINVDDLATQNQMNRADIQRQVETEAKILAQHAHEFLFIPDIYEFWSEGGRTYLVMKYISGVTLEQQIQRHGPWSGPDVEAFLREMLENLAQLHAVDVIHRDIKPSNIKYTPSENCDYVLLDFGIAKQGQNTQIKGSSLHYAPLEQLRQQATDARTDLYSLAATAYFLLTGKSPIQAILPGQQQFPALREVVPALPFRVDAALTAMMQHNPQDRPRNALAALDILNGTVSTGRLVLPESLAQSTASSSSTSPVAMAVAPQPIPAVPVSLSITSEEATRLPTPHAPPIPSDTRPSPSSRVWRFGVLGVAALVAVVLLALLFWPRTPSISTLSTPVAPTVAPATAAAPAVAITVAPTTAPTTAPVLSNSRIVFSSNRDGDFDIWTANIDGTNPQNLTPGSSLDDINPVWSPDGRQIAFASRRGPTSSLDIYVMDADATDVRPLTNGPEDDDFPAWSPDGSQVAFAGVRNGQSDIFTIDVNGGNEQPVTNDAARDITPDWSPAGLAFASERDGNFDIFVRNGDAEQQLTNDSADELDPAWSPDGQRLAFTAVGGGFPDVFSIGVDGSNRQNLTQSPANDSNPAWSPDGTQIVFTLNRAGNDDVYVMNADGSEQRPLGIIGQSPAWQR